MVKKYQCGCCLRKFNTKNDLMHRDDVGTANNFLKEGYYCSVCLPLTGAFRIIMPNFDRPETYTPEKMEEYSRENSKEYDRWCKEQKEIREKIIEAQIKAKIPKKDRGTPWDRDSGYFD